MIKQLPQEDNYEITKHAQDRSRGLQEPFSSWNIVRLLCLPKPDGELQKRNWMLQGNGAEGGDVEVVCDMYFSTIGKTGELEEWKQMHVCGIDGISCQHLT